jgi:hypothetical protein
MSAMENIIEIQEKKKIKLSNNNAENIDIFTSIPNDVLFLIWKELDFEDIIRCEMTCKRFRNESRKANEFWFCICRYQWRLPLELIRVAYNSRYVPEDVG